jgi:CheY-specific phosphatase CheX
MAPVQAELGAEVVNAFLVPIVELMRTRVGLEAELSMIDFTQQIEPPPWQCVTVAVKGKLVGPVTWVVSEPLARAMAGKLDATSDGMQAVTALARLSVGSTTGRLGDAGYEVEILPPEPLSNAESARRLPQGTLVVTLRTAAGKLKLILGLRPHD